MRDAMWQLKRAKGWLDSALAVFEETDEDKAMKAYRKRPNRAPFPKPNPMPPPPLPAEARRGKADDELDKASQEAALDRFEGIAKGQSPNDPQCRCGGTTWTPSSPACNSAGP